MPLNKRIGVIGHRGSRGTHPENTLVGFEEAVKAGADAIEMDVHLTKDKIPIIFHDPEINHLCSKNGKKVQRPIPIYELTFEEVLEYDCAANFHVAFPKQKRITERSSPIMTLEELFIWAKKKAPKQRLVVELKMPPDEHTRIPNRHTFAKKICDLVKKHSVKRRAVFQSFDYPLLKSFEKLMPEIERSHLFHSSKYFPEVAQERQATRVTPKFKLLKKKRIEECHAAGIRVYPYTVNRPKDWKKCVEWGVDGIVTDYPRELVAFLKRVRKKKKSA